MIQNDEKVEGRIIIGADVAKASIVLKQLRDGRPGTIRNFVHGGAGYHLGGCLHETLTEHDGELRFGC